MGAALGAEATPTIAPLPLTLFKNPGRFGADVDYVAHRSGMAAWFARDAFTVRFADRVGAKGTYQGAAVRYSFVGASPDAALAGEDTQVGRVHVLLGSDPGAWAQHLPTYAQVRYADVYEGVDVVVHGGQGVLTYDLVLDPGVDPGVVRMRCEGVDRLALDANGDLLCETAFGTIRQSLPTTWSIAADGSRRAVESAFVLNGDGTYGFRVADPGDGALLIDPGLTWNSYLGGANADGSGNEHACGVDIDDDCAAYVAGDTLSLNFPVTVGSFDTTPNGDSDAYVTKIVGKGNVLLFSTFLGGTQGDFGHGVKADAQLFVYAAGGTNSTDFPISGGAFDSTYNGNGDVFVSKLSPDGSTLLYSTYIGGQDTDASLGAHGLEVDAAGNAYITGETASSDFPVTGGAFDTVYNGGFRDVFVTKLSPNGGQLLYSTFIGGNGPGISDSGTSIALDAAGNAFVVGLSTSQNFPTTPGSVAPNPPGNGANAFVFKLDNAGGALGYSSYVGGTGDVARGVTVDPNGDCYTVGFTASNVFATTPGAFDISPNGLGDGWISVMNAAGSALRYASYLGGADVDLGNAVGVDSAGHAYITGWTQSSNFPTTASAFDKTHNYVGPFPSGPSGTSGAEDVYVTRVSVDGSKIEYSTYIGGSGIDVAFAIAVHDVGALYVAGGTRSNDFPTTLGAFDPTYNGVNGDQDAFVILLPAGEQPCPAMASSAAYGTGKAGKNGVPVLSAMVDAKVGQTVKVQLSQAHENVPVFLLLGIQQNNLPFAGGTVLVNPVWIVSGMTDANGDLLFMSQLDENPNFCGATWFAQALVKDPTVFLASLSNGLALTVGS